MMTFRTASLAWALLPAALMFSGVVRAADPAPDTAQATCVKVARAGSRIPVKVCGDEHDIRGELAYPQPGVTPGDRVSRLDEHFPWLSINNGGAAAGPR